MIYGQRLLSYAKFSKQYIQYVLCFNRTTDFTECFCGTAQILGQQLGRGVLYCAKYKDSGAALEVANRGN